MTCVKVHCEVRVYEHDGKEVEAFKAAPMVVESHWNLNGMAVITPGDDGRSYTVRRGDLIVALKNAGETNG